MKIEGHPILPAPGMMEIQAEMARNGGTAEEALRRLLDMRENVIEAEEADPLRYGYEPGIWHVCDALIDFPFCNDRNFIKELRKRTDQTDRTDGQVWEWFKVKMRQVLGFVQAVTMLLILGGNRSSKTQYAAKRTMMLLTQQEDARAAVFQMSNPRSIEEQQPVIWDHFPPEWKGPIRTTKAYIKYTQKNGFAGESFILPNNSDCFFKNYSQERSTALEGMEKDFLWPDELVPADWVETMMLRLATRDGHGVITFTPVNGYTPTVKMFCAGAKEARTCRGYLLPKDGGEKDEAGALGLTPEQYQEILAAAHSKRAARAPQSVPEDVIAWLTPDAGRQTTPLREAATAGQADDSKQKRIFEEMPRVLRCLDPKKGVVYFFSNDNPYGNPKNVIGTVRLKPAGYIRERFYGKADKVVSNKFPRFSVKIHTIKPKDIPTEGTNFMIMDPASGRNAFMGWFRACKNKKKYLYREWPGNYPIPGVGVPGPWAIPSGKKDGINDGARGEAQGPWGFGNLRYKFEIARLEGWRDYEEWKENGDEYPEDEELENWDERVGAREVITARFMDSRAASSPRVENDRPITLQTSFDEILLYFNLTPGKAIDAEGEGPINTALDYELNEHDEFINEPEFYVSSDCNNTIYALENWTNADGEKGACKDPVDVVRYFYMAEDCEYEEGGVIMPRGGFSYGTATRDHGKDRVRYKPRRLPPAVVYTR
jgi:hypothetical protein